MIMAPTADLLKDFVGDRKVPQSFAETASLVETFARTETAKSAMQKQLYYHNCDHVEAVKQRALRIFDALEPLIAKDLDPATASADLDRMRHLISISTIAHDMVQEFLPDTPPQLPRRRETGVSEAATIAKLVDYIHTLNDWILEEDPDSQATFSEADIQVIKESIEATVCVYDPEAQTIYQVLLNHPVPTLSLPARIMALADLGALGMDGLAGWRVECSQIFLEENPDVIPIIWNSDTQQLSIDSTDPDQQVLYEDVRKRLLQRARFQISFAKGRISRFEQEVAGLSDEMIHILKTEIFQHLNPQTLQIVENSTPTDDSTSLKTLIEFLKLEPHLREIESKFVPC